MIDDGIGAAPERRGAEAPERRGAEAPERRGAEGRAASDPGNGPDDPFELAEIYGDFELARIDRQAAAPAAPPTLAERDMGTAPAVPRYPMARRLGITGAMLAGAMAGIGDVFEPEGARHHIINYAPDSLDENDQLVTFKMVPDEPGLSRIIVRPWLRRHWNG